jgi:Ca2+-binding EF-hand superfamily protein
MKIAKVLALLILLAGIGYYSFNYFKNSSPQSQQADWYKKIDKDGDGKLSAAEFKAMDTNGDGVISQQEAEAYGVPASEFKRWDKNGDGSLSQEELNTCGC